MPRLSAMARYSSTRRRKPSASAFQSMSWRKTRMTLKPMPAAQPSSRSWFSGPRCRPATSQTGSRPCWVRNSPRPGNPVRRTKHWPFGRPTAFFHVPAYGGVSIGRRGAGTREKDNGYGTSRDKEHGLTREGVHRRSFLRVLPKSPGILIERRCPIHKETRRTAALCRDQPYADGNSTRVILYGANLTLPPSKVTLISLMAMLSG